MRILFHGAAQTVTGSMHLIEENGFRLLLDCGLFQGPRKETYERNRSFPFDPRSIDAVLLSHAHIDHSGNLPHLVRQGFGGPIYCTPATADLADVMLRDAGHIQEADAEFVNKHRLRRGEEPVEPLYTQEDAAAVVGHFKPIQYDQGFLPLEGVSARFVEAGHILGSAAIDMKIQEKSRSVRVWFSGDIGRRNLPILRDPVLPKETDILIMESTYGDKPHHTPEEAYIEFRDVVKKTLERGGKLIIPAFAVGRTQELAYNLRRMIDERAIPRVHAYVDSPLAMNATRVFMEHYECFDEDMKLMLRERRHPSLDFELLHFVQSVEESKALNDHKEPMIIIAASGMAESGRILHHLKNNIENPNNTICIVGWQSPNTLGRRLAERERFVKIFGETYERRAEVATIGGLSAHAGQNLLTEYALGVKESAKAIYLVHGEEKSAMALKEILQGHDMPPIYYPEMHSSAEI